MNGLNVVVAEVALQVRSLVARAHRAVELVEAPQGVREHQDASDEEDERVRDDEPLQELVVPRVAVQAQDVRGFPRPLMTGLH